MPFFVAALREKIRNCVTLKSIAHAECAAGGVMENGMPRIRIATAGASILFFLAVMLGSAAAQSATGPVGKPLPLLQFTEHRGKAKLAPHPKLAAVIAKRKKPFLSRERIARHVVARPRRAIMEARRVPAPAAAAAVPVASAAMPQNIWPTADAAAAPAAMPTLTPDQSPPAVTTEPTVNTDPDQIVTGGHSVPAALPNERDQAAPPPAPAKTAAVASAAPAPVVHAMVVTAEPQNTGPESPIGSASWIAHVLAALGGAIAAGAAAWFLIRPASERSYE